MNRSNYLTGDLGVSFKKLSSLPIDTYGENGERVQGLEEAKTLVKPKCSK